MNSAILLLQDIADPSRDLLCRQSEVVHQQFPAAAEQRFRVDAGKGVLQDPDAAAVFTSGDFKVDGTTGLAMSWQANGEVNKAPMVVGVENGAYVTK